MKWLLTLYARLLRLYPAAFYDRFHVEMHHVFQQTWTARQSDRPAARMAFVLREFAGLFRGIAHSWLATQRGNPMTKIVTNGRIVLPLLALGCILIAGTLSLNYWGYLFVQPSSAPAVDPLATIDSIHLVRLDAEYRASALPLTELPSGPVPGIPMTNVIAHLPDDLPAGTLQATPLDPVLADQIATALRAEQVQIGTPRTFYSEPRYCLPGCEVCFKNSALFVLPLPYCLYSGVQILPDGDLLEIHPEVTFWNGTALPTGGTIEHRTTPDNWAYYSYLFPVGYVIQGRDRAGAPLILVNMATTGAPGEGGDHYAYYELLFDVSATGLHKRVDNRYQFDLAGLEGYTFPYIALTLFALLTALWLALMGARRIAHWADRLLRRAPRRFA